MISLPPYQKSILVGLLLSDGYIQKGKLSKTPARLGFKQSLSHSGYV
jgi:hypothetical protein